MQKTLLILSLSLLAVSLYAQTTQHATQKELCLLTGAGIGKSAYIDLGVSLNKFGVTGHHPFATACFVSNELHFTDKPVIGPKIGVWAAGGVAPLAMGLNVIYYSDFDRSSLVFRPEIGFGLDKFKLTYGYNARLTNKYWNGVAKNIFSLVYCFRLKQLSTPNQIKG